MATFVWPYNDGGNIQFSNGTADQIYIWGNDSANATTSTTAGGFTDTGTTTSGTDGIIWTIAYAQPGATAPGHIIGPEEPPVVQRIATIPPADQPQVIANARGQDLLKEIVGDVMYRRFQKQGWIDIRSADKPGIMYRIQPWREIALLERNAKKEWVSNHQSICIHARETHVEGDEVAAHVLLCRYNEKTLWKMGNLHGVRRAA